MSGREEYPRNEGDATTDKLKNWFQMAPVARVEFNIGDKDFTPQLVEVQKANPEVIAFFGNPAEAAIAMRQAKELGHQAAVFRRQQHGRSRPRDRRADVERKA